jgi:hypothetical protein
VVLDSGNAERECIETNNTAESAVISSAADVDLEITLGPVQDAACQAQIIVPTTLSNFGSADVSDVVVRYFAGDPNAGGTPIEDVIISGPVPANGTYSEDVTLTQHPRETVFTLWAIVDPDDAIFECSEGNNTAQAPDTVYCIVN